MRADAAILVADDHPAFRMGLAMALRQLGFGRVVEAANGGEAVAACHRECFDAIVLDVKMPVLDGLQAARAILALKASDVGGPRGLPPVVVLMSTFDQPAIVRAAEEIGVTGFLGKETDPTTLAALLDRWFAGRPVASAAAHRDRVAAESLTERERDVLRHLCRGASTREIAAVLGISAETVKDHLGRLYGKLEVSDRVSAVDAAHRLGWVTLEDLG